MGQLIYKTLFDLKHLFSNDNFSSFSVGSILGLISYTSLEHYITDTVIRIITTCIVAFFGGVIGVAGKEVGEKIKNDSKKWLKKK